MDVEMKMPDLATVSDAVKVLRWLVEVGQPVRRGQPLLEVETDKATVIVESAVAGTIKTLAARPDEEVPAGRVIAVFEAEGTPLAAAPAEVVAPPTPSDRPGPVAPPPPSPTPGQAGSFFARNRRSARAADDEPPP